MRHTHAGLRFRADGRGVKTSGAGSGVHAPARPAHLYSPAHHSDASMISPRVRMSKVDIGPVTKPHGGASGPQRLLYLDRAL